MNRYRAPWWLGGAGVIGGHAQTIWSALYARSWAGPRPSFRRERWTTPDGDFVDVDWLAGADATAPGPSEKPVPLLVLFHGLEGSSASPYSLAFAARARELGWRFAMPHFRGCSGEINQAPRAYHSGDHEEVGWILDRFRAAHPGALYAAGVSLGGNALLRWAGVTGHAAARTVDAIAGICAPLDLAAGGHAIGRGFNRLVYNRMFLATMRPKALAKLSQFPGLFDRSRLMAARDLYAFDDCFTAPLHGFEGVEDYWHRASSIGGLGEIRVPALVLNARNDPFVPETSLPKRGSSWVELWQPAEGGHVGFPHGGFPGEVMEMPAQVTHWLSSSNAPSFR